MKHRNKFHILLPLCLALLTACATATPAPTSVPAASAAPATAAATLPPATSIGTGNTVLRLATTTSTADTGLLNAILPGFNSQYGARVDVVAVGTGQAWPSARTVMPTWCWCMPAPRKTPSSPPATASIGST